MTPKHAVVAEEPNHRSEIPRYELTSWLDEYGVVAGVTGVGAGFDLGLWGRGAAADVLRSWTRFRHSFGPAFDGYVVGHQHHGVSVERCLDVRGGILVKDGKDGYASNSAGVLLTVMVADCVPVYLFDRCSGTFALLHSGWKGTAGGILKAGVEAMESLGVTRRGDIVMHCGVSICGDCYEVGPEVVEAVCSRSVSGPEFIDLREALVGQAARLDIGNVSVSSWCSKHDSGQFHSFRADGEKSGRMAAYLGIPLS